MWMKNLAGRTVINSNQLFSVYVLKVDEEKWQVITNPGAHVLFEYNSEKEAVTCLNDLASALNLTDMLRGLTGPDALSEVATIWDMEHKGGLDDEAPD